METVLISKVFVCNWVLLIFLARLDCFALDDAIEKSPVGWAFGLWAGISFLSVPAFVIYLIAIV